MLTIGYFDLREEEVTVARRKRHYEKRLVRFSLNIIRFIKESMMVRSCSLNGSI